MHLVGFTIEIILVYLFYLFVSLFIYWLILFSVGVADSSENLTTHNKYWIASLNSTHQHNNTLCGKMNFVMPQDVLGDVYFNAALLRVICQLHLQFRP